MTIDGIKIDGEATSGGEIEIERIPTRMIEARSKDLVPIVEYLRTPKFQQARYVIHGSLLFCFSFDGFSFCLVRL